MVIVLFKKTSFSSKAQRNWQTTFFCFFIVSTNKLKTNCILFFAEIMDSFSPKREQLAYQKVRSIFLFSSLFLQLLEICSGPIVPIDALSALFEKIPKFCLSSIIFVQFFKYFALFKHIFALFVRNHTHTFTLLNRPCCYIIIYCEDIIIYCEELFDS